MHISDSVRPIVCILCCVICFFVNCFVLNKSCVRVHGCDEDIFAYLCQEIINGA